MNKSEYNSDELTLAEVMVLQRKVSLLFWEAVAKNYSSYCDALSNNEEPFNHMLSEVVAKIMQSNICMQFSSCDAIKLRGVIDKYILDETRLFSGCINIPKKDLVEGLVCTSINRINYTKSLGDTLEHLSVSQIQEIKKDLIKYTDRAQHLMAVMRTHEDSLMLGVVLPSSNSYRK